MNDFTDPVWNGWSLDGEYLVDQDGNRYHPLFIRACYFYRQLTSVKDLVYWRPSSDHSSIDAHMPPLKQAPIIEYRTTDREGEAEVGRRTAPPLPPRSHAQTSSDQLSACFLLNQHLDENDF